MKTQIIKIIPCLLAGFILSACVGAVNLPAGTIAETKTEKTDETIDPKSIIIDDKEPAHPCIATPFRDTCGGEEFNDAREAICLTERDSHRCLAIISAVCTGDIFDSLCKESFNNARERTCATEIDSERCAPTIARICGTDAFDKLCGSSYNSVREITCADELDSERCRPTIARICEANAFDRLCGLNRNFLRERERICNRERDSDRCAPTVVRVCTKNSLDYLCGNKEIYFTAQEITCRKNPNFHGCQAAIRRLCSENLFEDFCNYPQDMSAREIICADEPNSDRCVPTVAEICGLNIFDSLCNKIETYHAIQKTRCAREPNSERCALTVAQVCVANPFNSLCDGNETYYLAKETTCASEPRSDRCAPTLDRVCGADVFGAFCQSVNLTLHDIPPSYSINQFAGDSLNVNCDVTLIGFSDDYYNYRCYVDYPMGINIKPLNDSNTGTATYAGSVIAQYHSNRANPVITKSIDIIADFDNNTLSYSGNLIASNNYSSVFSINGNFTDRGILTGKVNLGSQEANLRGLIGQDEVLGVFASESVRFRGSLGTGIFAGGFTATRQK